jgi:hypothetical protein
VVVIIALEAVVKVHQAQYWNHIDRVKPKHGIIFPDIKRRDADLGLLPCAKFFMNYTFYKFGLQVDCYHHRPPCTYNFCLQICFIMTMITMVVRLDAYSVLYGVMLGVLLLLNRQTANRIWPVYMIILMVLLVLQYLSCLGVPPGLCWGESDWPSLHAHSAVIYFSLSLGQHLCIYQKSEDLPLPA